MTESTLFSDHYGLGELSDHRLTLLNGGSRVGEEDSNESDGIE